MAFSQLTQGVPYDQIVKAVEDTRADLIVMGTHGRTGMRHVLLGSVAERVVRLAACPVLTVRSKGGGVLGHELAHVLHRDILISTVAATIAGAISYLTYWAQWGLMLGGNHRDRDGGPVQLIAALVAIIVAPLAAMLVQLAISRGREYHADEGGAALANPLSLASALRKLEAGNRRIPLDANPGTAHLFIVNPLRGGGWATLFSTHPPANGSVGWRRWRVAASFGRVNRRANTAAFSGKAVGAMGMVVRFSILAFWIMGLASPFSSPLRAEDNPPVAGLTLEESLQFAEEHNPQLVAAHEKVRAAEGGIVEMRSGLYPHLDASAGVFHLESPPTLTLGPLIAPIGREDMRFINVGATQTLYAGGRIQGGIESARLARVDAKERLRALSREVATQVKNAYYGVLFARELVRVRQDALALLQEHLATTQARFRQGTAAEFDMLRADVEVANARPPLIEAENQLATAEEHFKRALGFDLDSAVSVNGELRQRPVPFAGAEAAAESAAYACRAEVEAARAAVRLADTQTRIARAGDKPTVSLSANYFGTSPEYFMAPSEDLRWNWMAGVNVALPLFSGFQTRGRVAKFQAESAGARAQLHDVEQQVRLETRQAFLRIREADELVRSQAQNVVQAEKALRIARRRYEQGLGTQLDVTDSRVALTQARVNELSALYRHELAVAELERAVGCPPGTPTEGMEGDEP